MNYEALIEAVENIDATLPDEGLTSSMKEEVVSAMAFVHSLHEMFKENGMTTSEEPDVDELENLVDALAGELGAACIFLSEPAFSRVPDMLRTCELAMSKDPDATVVPKPILKGFGRFASRIEKTRVTMANIVQTTIAATDKENP